MSRWLIVVLVGALALSIVVSVAAQSRVTKNVEIRVWESTADATNNFISARPEGGSWRTLGTIPIPLDGETSTGTFRYGDITLGVPIELPEPEAPGLPAFIELTCIYTLEVREYTYIEDDYWWEFKGTAIQNLPFDISPRLAIEILREDGLRDELLTVRMDQQEPGRQVTWNYGDSYSTDIEQFDLASASIVYVDDGYSDDRRIYLEPSTECAREQP